VFNFKNISEPFKLESVTSTFGIGKFAHFMLLLGISQHKRMLSQPFFETTTIRLHYSVGKSTVLIIFNFKRSNSFFNLGNKGIGTVLGTA